MSSLSFCYAVLCGGKSLRMGHDKALLLAYGRPIIERIVDDIEIASDLCERLFICSGEKKYAHLRGKNLNYLGDYLTDHQGPLSGLAAALEKIASDQSLSCQWVFSFPSDTLLLPSQTFCLLKDAIEQNPDCNMVYLSGDRDHPLHAAYRVDIAEQLFAYLNQGQRAVMPFIKQLNCQTVVIPESWQDYLNFNTVEGFEKALQAHQHAR
jgi:molybdopterin-guanine dinucleotide biosynthesis protein A